jgi:hypothetical protein
MRMYDPRCPNSPPSAGGRYPRHLHRRKPSRHRRGTRPGPGFAMPESNPGEFERLDPVPDPGAPAGAASVCARAPAASRQSGRSADHRWRKCGANGSSGRSRRAIRACAGRSSGARVRSEGVPPASQSAVRCRGPCSPRREGSRPGRSQRSGHGGGGRPSGSGSRPRSGHPTPRRGGQRGANDGYFQAAREAAVPVPGAPVSLQDAP